MKGIEVQVRKITCSGPLISLHQLAAAQFTTRYGAACYISYILTQTNVLPPEMTGAVTTFSILMTSYIPANMDDARVFL